MTVLIEGVHEKILRKEVTVNREKMSVKEYIIRKNQNIKLFKHTQLNAQKGR